MSSNLKITAVVIIIFFKFTKVTGSGSSSEPLYAYFPLYIIGGLVGLLLLWCFCVYFWSCCEVMWSTPDVANNQNTEQIISK